MAIKIGIAPDSWGVWFPASDPNNAKQPQWWRCLDEMKIAGYEGCEIGPWGYMPNDDPKVLKNAMDARGLTLVGATEGGNFLDDAAVEGMLRDIDDISALLKAFPSAKYIVLLPPMYTNLATGELEMNPELTDEEWATYCKNVQKCADRCAANGFIGLFHPHVDSHVQTEAQIERFLNDTNVDLCFDTGHHVYGGGADLLLQEVGEAHPIHPFQGLRPRCKGQDGRKQVVVRQGRYRGHHGRAGQGQHRLCRDAQGARRVRL